jgi:two-component system LytT family sensor kinase
MKTQTLLESDKPKSNQMNWILSLIAINMIWLLNFGIIHTDALASRRLHYNPWEAMVREFTGAYAVFAVIPLIFLMWRKFPYVRPHRLRLLPLYLLATVAFGFMHTTLMHLSRDFLYPLFGFRAHDPGNLGFRYLMEFQKQFIWIWGTIGILVLVRHNKSFHQNQLRSAQLHEQLTQSRLDVLRQQIDPHFLFNSLNLISNAVYESPEKADRLITSLSDLLRCSLDLGRAQKVPLKKELDFLEKYLLIMKGRFGDRFDFKCQLDSKAEHAVVPSLLLQPVLENSFKHRLETNQANLTISFSSVVRANKLRLRFEDVSDSPIGDRSALKGESKSGLGLKNIEQRLHALYGDEGKIEYGREGEFRYRTDIEIPFEMEED